MLRYFLDVFHPALYSRGINCSTESSHQKKTDFQLVQPIEKPSRELTCTWNGITGPDIYRTGP